MNARLFSRLLSVAFLASVLAAPAAEGIDLDTPVLKHCPVDQWTATSFTADIQAAVPGATSYLRLRRLVRRPHDCGMVRGQLFRLYVGCQILCQRRRFERDRSLRMHGR